MTNPNPLADNTSPLLTTSAAARLLNLSTRYLEAMRVRGGGPVFYAFGRAIRYRSTDLTAWAETNARRSTSDRSLVVAECEG